MKSVIMFALAIVAFAAVTSVPYKAHARNKAAKHSCVTVQDTPTHKSVDCIGDGSACETVSVC